MDVKHFHKIKVALEEKAIGIKNNLTAFLFKK
jgi:hypothetical protein